MTEYLTIQRKRFPILKFSLVLSVLICILYQFITSYILDDFIFPGFFRDLFLTITEGVFFTVSIYFFSLLNDRYAKFLWLFRYPLEWLLLVVAGFYFLYAAHCFKIQAVLPISDLLQTGSYRLYVCINLVGITFYYILITVFKFYQQMLDKSLRAEQMRKEYAGTRLQALKSQVNPHFLFNSLSVLSSLVRSSADMSEKFIIQLSKAYRYILDQKEVDLISLKEELEFLNAYFFLMLIRFNNKVQLHKNIDVDPAFVFLPPLTLQLLVENAVKHNSMSLVQPLIISLNIKGEVLQVTNNVNKRDVRVSSTGIGLDNIRNRLAYVTDDPMKISSNETSFTVSIPLIKKIK